MEKGLHFVGTWWGADFAGLGRGWAVSEQGGDEEEVCGNTWGWV